jgi:polysaccharide biosynthesis protein PslH
MQEILFLAHRIPWPADRGDKIRSHHILRHLAAMAPVHVAAFGDDGRDMGFVGEMEPNFASVHIEMRNKPQMRAGLEALAARLPVSVSSFASGHMADHINALLASGKISHVFCFSGQMAQYIPAGFGGRFIMDFVDVDSAKFESYAGHGNPLMRWVNAREGRMLSAFEHVTARRADISLFVSEAEAALFRQRSGLASDRVAALGNGIDVVNYDPDATFPELNLNVGGPLIVFTGQMDYRPNIEAVCDFALNAMPEIRKIHPGATFAIVGRNPSVAVSALGSNKGVNVTGAVDDVRSWLKAADIVVAPLRIARGIQNKVLEAMAMAKPVVVSTAAAEGIDAQDGKHFRIAADVFAEARMVCELLSDIKSAKTIGNNARQHVSANYAWDSQLAILRQMMEPGNEFLVAAE